MKKKIDRLPAKVSQLGVRISMERNGARLISPSHIKFSGLMPASMLGGKAGKGRGRSWRWRRSWASGWTAHLLDLWASQNSGRWNSYL